MSKLTAVLIAVVSLSIPGAADAHAPRLTLARAESAIGRWAKVDQPLAYMITDCRRNSRMAITCLLAERFAPSASEGLIGLTEDVRVTLRHGRASAAGAMRE